MLVIVDDRDSAIHYTPAWHPVGKPIEFRSTTSVPLHVDESAQFTFTGTSIAVYGTMGPGNGTSMSFSVDGGGFPNTMVRPPGADTQHHVLFYQASALTDESHTLQITLNSFEGSESQLFLDYLLYDTSNPVGKTAVVDDTDVQVAFSPAEWAPNNTEAFFQKTSHFSQATGAWVSLSFTGSALSLFGSYSGQRLTASIDNGDPQPLSSANGARSVNSEIFVTPDQLSPGPHTVKITVADGTLSVDYFLFDSSGDGPSTTGSSDSDGNTAQAAGGLPGQSTAETGGSSSVTQTGATGSSAVGAGATGIGNSLASGASGSASLVLGTPGVGAGSTLAAQMAPSAAANDDHPPVGTALSAAQHTANESHVGATVGGAIAGVAVLLFIAAGILLWRRRRRRRRTQKTEPPGDDIVLPPVSYETGEGGTARHRDSMATLTNSDVGEKAGELQEPQPKDESRYLYYQDS